MFIRRRNDFSVLGYGILTVSSLALGYVGTLGHNSLYGFGWMWILTVSSSGHPVGILPNFWIMEQNHKFSNTIQNLKKNVLLTFLYFLINGFGLNHTKFHMDFSQSNPQRSFEGFTLELAIPEDGFPLDFYWMDDKF
ncbi:unnamed protein product [Rhizophagus irregularis]|nr:unnamed protein product [Rhizophagus irregularis]